MRLFIDTANIEEIREFAWLVDGVTTNPTLVAREKQSREEVIAEISALVDGPISAEVLSLDTEGMIAEARVLARMSDNIVVKIPLCEAGVRAIAALRAEGINTNATLVFSGNQALLAAKAGASYVSPFVGRIDDVGGDGMDVVAEIIEIYDNYAFETEIIVASVRHPRHVLEAALLGAEIATVPYAVLKKMFNHPLTDVGIEKFLRDAKGG